MNDNYRRQPSRLCSAASTGLVLQQQVQLEADLAGCHLGGLPSPPAGPAELRFEPSRRSRTVQPARDEPRAACRHQSQHSAAPRPQEPERRGARGRAAEQPAHSTFRAMFASLLGARQSRAKQPPAATQQREQPQPPSQRRDSDLHASQLRPKLSAVGNQDAPAARHMSQPREAPPDGDQTCDTNPNPNQNPNQKQQHSKQALHVNFTRPGARQAAPANGRRDSGPLGARDDDDDDENGDSCRKKKYLTAKYGQQQMNLIKKRLKVEMWLCERLKELAKGSRSEAELADVDIDLDQLLDLEDDASRQNWLKKTLEPFDDLPGERVDGFVREVLEQSRLL